MSNIDLVIINPGAKSHLFPGEIGEKLSAVQPPYWTALLAAYVREKKFSVNHDICTEYSVFWKL